MNASDPSGHLYIARNFINAVLLVIAINPIPAVVIAFGVSLLKTRIIYKLTMFISKLGALFGPFVKWCLQVIAAITGLLIAKPFAIAIIDMYLQGTGGIYITFKKTKGGIPYGLDVYLG